MKNLICLLFVISLFGCVDNEPIQPKEFKVDPLATVSISPKVGAWNIGMKVKSVNGHLSAIDVVKQTTIMNLTDGDGFYGDRIFFDSQKDTISAIPKLLMFASDIINEAGLVSSFIDAKDVILCHLANPIDGRSKRDTIGFILNSTLRDAAINIRVAYNAKDIDRVNQLFKDAFTFLSITGGEYKILKQNGNQ